MIEVNLSHKQQSKARGSGHWARRYKNVGRLCPTQSFRNPAQKEDNASTFHIWFLRSVWSSLFQPMGRKKEL